MTSSNLFVKGTADLIVLRVLEKHGESYGYQIIEQIAQDSENVFAFQEGTLYPLLYKMERDGLVTSKRKPALSGKERRYYRLTEAGKKRLASRTKDYQAFSRGLRAVLEAAAV